ncbi:MAG: hypothetical protein HFE28_05790 [Clostridia bacterium]|jgi:uncharacterized protein YycO|nr:hypothetical protein [Clostridia bacterium]
MKHDTVNNSKKALRICYILLAVFVFFAAFVTALVAANVACERFAHIRPSYGREEIVPILAKDEKTEAEYGVLYRQTGLSAQGISRLERSYTNKDEFLRAALAYQDALFDDYDFSHEVIGPVSSRDVLTQNGVSRYAPLCPLENGDILVSSSCHTFGWRHGHAALVIDAQSGSVLESVTVGVNSSITYDGAEWFQSCASFLLLRLKDDYRDRIDPAQVAVSAVKTLNDIPYSLTVGIFGKKDQGERPRVTHCSHLVWQAYKNFGIDLDANGGGLVSSQDLANSRYLEVVQAFGFDPEQLWRY